MTKREAWIEEIGDMIRTEAIRRGYLVCSPIIAQACVESRYGESGLAAFHNYFGLKCGSSWHGASVNMKTKEEYTPGTLTSIRSNFRVYPNMEAGVAGYFDFINTSRYANLKTADNPQLYLTRIKADGYATSSTYVKTNMTIVNKYNLTEWDTFEAIEPKTEPKEKPAAIKYCKVIDCWYLSCRDKAGGSLLGVFKRDAVLVLLDNKTNWWKVTGKTIEGKTLTGYCYLKYLKEV
jgi:flagellum-specific peptidoglycan hydrolase FlgJ